MNIKEPLISVILPVYNIEEYLEKCMDSLYVQTYGNLEFVVVDDGSREQCSRLCDDLTAQDNRVAVYHKPNGGLSDARNYGIQRAKGEYLTCVDPDDYVDKDYIEYLYSLIEQSQTQISVCQHRVVYSGRVKDYGSTNDPQVLDAKECIERMLYHDVIDTSAWAKLYHKSLFNCIHYPTGRIYEDIATTYKLFMEGQRVAVGYESKYNYIVRGDSIVNNQFSKKKLDLIDMTDAMAEDVVSVYPDLQSAAITRQVYARISTLNQMIGVADIDEEREALIDYVRNYRKLIIDNPKVNKREKYAVRLLSLGYVLYEMTWSLYSKVEKRK